MISQQKEGWRFSALFSLRSFASTSSVSLMPSQQLCRLGPRYSCPPLDTAGASSSNALCPERSSRAFSWNPGCQMPQPRWNHSSGAKTLRSLNHIVCWPWQTLRFTILFPYPSSISVTYTRPHHCSGISLQRPSSFPCLSRTIIRIFFNHCSFTCVQLSPPPKDNCILISILNQPQLACNYT